MMKVDKGRVRPLVQERAVGRVVVRETEKTTPYKRPVERREM